MSRAPCHRTGGTSRHVGGAAPTTPSRPTLATRSFGPRRSAARDGVHRGLQDANDVASSLRRWRSDVGETLEAATHANRVNPRFRAGGQRETSKKGRSGGMADAADSKSAALTGVRSFESPPSVPRFKSMTPEPDPHDCDPEVAPLPSSSKRVALPPRGLHRRIDAERDVGRDLPTQGRAEIVRAAKALCRKIRPGTIVTRPTVLPGETHAQPRVGSGARGPSSVRFRRAVGERDVGFGHHERREVLVERRDGGSHRPIRPWAKPSRRPRSWRRTPNARARRESAVSNRGEWGSGRGPRRT